MNTHGLPRMLLVLMLISAGPRAHAQSCASVAGTYSGTETYTSRLKFGGVTDTLDGSENIHGLTISQDGCTFTYTLQFPGGSPAVVTRTGTLRGNEIISLTGPIAIAVDPAIKITRNEITSVSGAVTEGQVVINIVGVAEGTYQGTPGRLDVESTVVLTGPAVPVGKPVITAQPDSLSLRAGGVASFSVVASGGTALQYEWRKNGGNLADGKRLSGAKSRVLIITDVQPSDAGDHTVVVSNAYGSVTSSPPARLIVQPPLSSGSNVVIRVHGNASSGASLVNGPHTVSWTQAFGASNVTIAAQLFRTTTADAHGTAYLTTHLGPSTDSSSLVVSSEFHLPETLSYVTLFSELHLPPGVYYLTLVAPDAAWGRSADPVMELGDGVIRGVTYFSRSSGLFPPASQFADYSQVYFGQLHYEVLSLAPGDQQSPTIIYHPKSLRASPGGTAFFSVAATGQAPLAYEWRFGGAKLTDGIQPSGSVVSGATREHLTIADLRSNDAGAYTVVVTNADGGVTSGVAVLKVLAHPIDDSVLAAFHFEGGLEDSSKHHNMIDALNVLLTNGAVFLNGVYEFQGPAVTNGYRATARVPQLDYRKWTISVDVNPQELLPDRPLIVGGRLYRWFELKCQANQGLWVSLNNGEITYPLNYKFVLGAWQRITATVDLFERSIRVYVEGKRVGMITLPLDFEFNVIGTVHEAIDKDFTFSNYGSGVAYSGFADNLIVFNEALSDQLVAELAWLVPGAAPLEFEGQPLVSTGLFSTRVAGAPGTTMSLLSSTDLTNWIVISTSTIPAGGLPLSLPTATNRQQFFRARIP